MPGFPAFLGYIVAVKVLCAMVCAFISALQTLMPAVVNLSNPILYLYLLPVMSHHPRDSSIINAMLSSDGSKMTSTMCADSFLEFVLLLPVACSLFLLQQSLARWLCHMSHTWPCFCINPQSSCDCIVHSVGCVPSCKCADWHYVEWAGFDSFTFTWLARLCLLVPAWLTDALCFAWLLHFLGLMAGSAFLLLMYLLVVCKGVPWSRKGCGWWLWTVCLRCRNLCQLISWADPSIVWES